MGQCAFPSSWWVGALGVLSMVRLCCGVGCLLAVLMPLRPKYLIFWIDYVNMGYERVDGTYWCNFIFSF